MACVMCGGPTKGDRKTCSEPCRRAALSSNADRNRIDYGRKSDRVREMRNEKTRKFDLAEEVARFKRSQS